MLHIKFIIVHTVYNILFINTIKKATIYIEVYVIHYRRGEVGCTISSFICLSAGAMEW